MNGSRSLQVRNGRLGETTTRPARLGYHRQQDMLVLCREPESGRGIRGRGGGCRQPKSRGEPKGDVPEW